MFELPSFFNSRLEPWIGKVVSQKAQKLNSMVWDGVIDLKFVLWEHTLKMTM